MQRNRQHRVLAALAVAAALTPLRALATTFWHSGTLNWIYPQADGSVVLTFTTDHPSCTNTASPKYYLVMVGQAGVTADGMKNMVATALSAFAMGRTLNVNFDDATNNCFINRMFMQ